MNLTLIDALILYGLLALIFGAVLVMAANDENDDEGPK